MPCFSREVSGTNVRQGIEMHLPSAMTWKSHDVHLLGLGERERKKFKELILKIFEKEKTKFASINKAK